MATNNPKIELPSSERTALAGAVTAGPADSNEIIEDRKSTRLNSSH